MRNSHKSMYMGLSVEILLFMLGLTGCSSVKHIESFDAKGQQIVVIILIPEKHVEFCEITNVGTLFFPKVIDNMYAFTGIWQPEAQIEASVTQAIAGDKKLRNISVTTCPGRNGCKDIISVCETAYNNSRKRQEAIVSSYEKAGVIREWHNSPPKEYLRLPLSKDACIIAKSLGADFLLEITLAGMAYETSRSSEKKKTQWELMNKSLLDIMVDTAPSHCWIGLYGRIIRVSDGKVVRYTSVESSKSVKGAKTFSNLEADNLKMIKNHFEQGLQTVLVKKKLLRKLLL